MRPFAAYDSDLLRSTLFAHRGSPSGVVGASELAERIEEALLEFPKHQREIVVLRAVCGMSFREIADELGVEDEGTVRVAYHRLVKRLEERVLPNESGDSEA